MKAQLRGAARTLCDTSDDLVDLSHISFVNHPAEKGNADIIWIARTGLAYSNVPPFGVTSPRACGVPAPSGYDAVWEEQPGPSVSRLYVYGTAESFGQHEAMTIAHELGHLMLGLDDQYSDQRGGSHHLRSTAFSGLSSDFIKSQLQVRRRRVRPCGVRHVVATTNSSALSGGRRPSLRPAK